MGTIGGESCLFSHPNPGPENPLPSCNEAVGDNEFREPYDQRCWYLSEPCLDPEYARQHNLYGIWLPEAPPLFRPFIADPRAVTYSAGWRFGDHLFVDNVIPVSFGDIFPIFRWCDLWSTRGDLEIGIEGGVWAIFDPLHNSSPLIDADYYVGFPLSYAFGNWAFRLRGYHISTHIGDEYLLDHPHFHRLNPSYEALDFYVSNYVTEGIRLYAGIGWVPFQDDSFHTGKMYLQGGAEWRMLRWQYQDHCNRLCGHPFVAIDLYYQSHFKHRINTNLAAGYEWSKISGLRHRLRIFVEYHNGYSMDGQFCKFPTHYVTLKGCYGY